MTLPMKAGLPVTRNAAATAEFSNRPDFSWRRPRPTQARRNKAAPRGSRRSRTATSSAEQGPSARTSKTRSRFAVRRVWLSQYAVLRRTIDDGSGNVAAGRSGDVALIEPALVFRTGIRPRHGPASLCSLQHGAIEIAFQLHPGAAMAHEGVRDRQVWTHPYRLVPGAQRFEIVPDARVVVGPLAAAHRPDQRIDRDDAATAEVLGALERDARGFLPFQAGFRFESHAGHHGRVDVAAAPVAHGGLERLHPAVVADIPVLPGAHFREQRLRPDLEIETNVLHQLLGVELGNEIIGDRPGAQRDRDPARVRLLYEPRKLQEALALLAPVRERAAHEIDVADLRLVAHRVHRLAHALERRRRNFDLAHFLAKGRRAFVGRPIGAEAAAHRDAVFLVQEVLAARRDVDHQHAPIRGDAGLR